MKFSIKPRKLALTLCGFALGSLSIASLQAAGVDEIPADEIGIVPEQVDETVKNDASAISGSFGKCLKGADTRCYYMDIAPKGGVTILSYISQRKRQFDEDPGTDKPHCYRKIEKQLTRLGQYTYAWSNENQADSSKWIKIVTTDSGLHVYSGNAEKLQLPVVTKQQRDQLKVCES